MPVFICPNCRERTVDVDGYEGFTTNVPQCRNCGFGFLFQLLEDYYPAPETGFVVCDRHSRVLASGRADALAGRYIHAEHDDIEDLIRRADEIAERDLNAIRLRR